MSIEKPLPEKSEYDIQAENFLEKTGAKIEVEFLKNAFHFEDDKETRDIYKITLSRGRQNFVFDFGQSLFRSDSNNPNFAIPSFYDILSCLTKYNPGTFKDFCSDYGYDADSRKAEKTYNAVVQEYLALSNMFTPDEMTELAEIQ